MPEIKRLAIVNRGEAAMRCVRAVKSLRAHERSDMEVIALYTDADRDAPFVRQADRAIEISHSGGAVAAYLDHEGLLTALKQVEADAVWPGWGFVAESPDFVDKLAKAGITFLGPTAAAMRSLGDKITSKIQAEEAQVPVSPWSGGELKDEQDALEHARNIGFPVVIKATAGGGGRGIRMIDREDDLAEGFRSAASEAKGAFGDARLFLEKRVENGRHIEVQIAADLHGNVIAVGSRDCSVQRRHQKVLEEAPPPDLSPELRGKIEASAVRIASHVQYSGVGTVEFLLQGDFFYFLEVNPRLQVEHGITEEITGLDLVQLQIRIARGESIKHIEIQERGVAIEARLCAEDPDQGFLPSPGRIVRFEPPMGPRVRIDSGVVAGSTVPPDFDSLVAKVIATGEDRDDALARLECVMQDLEVVIEGGATNRGYILELLEKGPYREGAVDTGWLDRRERTASSSTDLLARDSFVAAAILAYQRRRAIARLNFYSDVSRISPERIPASTGQQIDVSFRGESYRTTVYATGAWGYRVHLDGRVVGAKMREEGDNRARLQIDDRTRRILYDASDLGLRIEIDGQPFRYSWQTAGQVLSGTPAMVVSIQVKEGDTVKAGAPLGLVEAMKMEIAFHAPVSGVVSEVRVRQGQQVSAGEVLLVIEPSKSGEADAAASARIELPEQTDPLAVLFQPDGDDPLGTPDLLAADRAERPARRAAIEAVLEEVRRVLLGFDANPDRSERLVAFLEAPIPEGVSLGFLEQLSRIRDALSSFVDTEELFISAPRASISGDSGDVGPSNAARFRMFVRRLRASGAGIAEEFLDLVRRALGHYGVKQLEPSDALERAVLRLFAIQFESGLRLRLVLAVLRHVTALAEAGIEFEKDRKLSGTLIRITRMRGRLSDTIADASHEANYVLYEKHEVEKAAEQRSRDLETWLRESESKPTEPSAGVMLEVAAAAKRVFDRVGNWLAATDPSLREIALAAHVQRVYSPAIPSRRSFVRRDGIRVLCFEYPDAGLVVAATPGEKGTPEAVAKALVAATRRYVEVDGQHAHSMELLVSIPEGENADAVVARVAAGLEGGTLPCRLVLGLIQDDGDDRCKTFEVDEASGRLRENESYLELHPETAERIFLDRLSGFELERLPGEEGIYTFHGRSREEPGDERVFVLADARDRTPGATAEAERRIPAFVRVFHRAARSLRTVLQTRDPHRRLQWNRIAIAVAPAILLDRETATKLARRLLPATRHLGLEKVTVRLSRLDPDNPGAPAQPLEVVITDTGPQMEISWREPHDEPLRPAGDYERKVVAARRRHRVYPYEIISMLTSDDEARLADEVTDEVAHGSGRSNGQSGIPRGRFTEYDLDASAEGLVAVPIDREPGRNEAAVVFGVISTPTDKHPEGMTRVLALSDPTLGMGALSIPECDRLVAALDLAEKLGVPFEWVPVSSGAKIAMDSGTENLDATARVVRRIVNFTQAGGEINVIVQGTNVGAQSYFDALATMLMHTRGALIMTPNASMVLTGRAALEASGAVAAEDEEAIGGYERIMGPNGQAQYYARNLAEAYQTLFDYYRYTYVAPGESTPRAFETSDPDDRSVCEIELLPEEGLDFKTVGEIFDDETNPGRKRPFDMRSVMKAVIDQDGGYLERWRQMVGAETAIVWDAHIGGLATTVIGIESKSLPRDGYRPFDGPESWTGGTLFPLSSKKVARAINAASGRRPVVVLANLSGFDGSPESLRKLQLEYGAEIATAVVNFQGPLLFQVVSRYHGGAYVVFSQELNDSMKAFALSGSYASVIGGGPAAKVVFARDVRVRALADERVKQCERDLRILGTTEAREALDAMIETVTLEQQAELAAEFDEIHSVERAREVGSLERIIEPEAMRETLISELRAMLGAAPKQ